LKQKNLENSIQKVEKLSEKIDSILLNKEENISVKVALPI